MAQAAGAVHAEAQGTSASAAKSSQDLTAVAAAVEELNSSVAEISRQLAEATNVARQAVQRADTSQATMQGLAEATGRIGEVVHLISDIAGQTNLLPFILRISRSFKSLTQRSGSFTHVMPIISWS